VPLDHRGAATGTLRLRYAVRDTGSPAHTVLFLTGGPGQPAVRYAERILERAGVALARVRLVLLDQRGTGVGALRCPQLQAEMGSSDLYPPSRAAVAGCARAIGPRRRFFGTDQTVEDIELLRRALGATRLALDGASYGAFVAERYALAHPDHVSRLVLDSVVPHEGAEALETTNAHAVARVLRGACRAAGCADDPARDLAAVVRRRGARIRLLDALVTMSIGDPTYRGVPSALRAAARGRPDALDRLVSRWAPDPETPAEEFSQGLHASALCADTPMPWGSTATPLGRRGAALHRAVARVRANSVWPFNRATIAANGLVGTCRWWPPQPAAPTRNARRLPPVPVLVLAGDRDLSTPLEWARREADRAPLGRLLVAHGAGHSVQTRSADDAVLRAVAAFLAGGDARTLQ
jgi:pimeloyl-ACP methyl ester carboxylesterase